MQQCKDLEISIGLTPVTILKGQVNLFPFKLHNAVK